VCKLPCCGVFSEATRQYPILKFPRLSDKILSQTQTKEQMGQLLCIEGISYCETIEARVAQAKLDQPSTPICSVCMNWCEANSQCQTCGFLAVLAVPPPSLLPHVQQIDPFGKHRLSSPSISSHIIDLIVKQILDNYVKMVPNPCANLAYEIKDLSKRLLQSPPSVRSL